MGTSIECFGHHREGGCEKRGPLPHLMSWEGPRCTSFAFSPLEATLPDPCGFPAALSQVIQLRSPDTAVPDHFDAVDGGAVNRKNPFDTDPAGNFPHSEGFPHSTVLPCYDNAFEDLSLSGSLAVTLDRFFGYSRC